MGSRISTSTVSTVAPATTSPRRCRLKSFRSSAGTSRQGNADVLSHLGVRIHAPPEVAAICLNQFGICFMFAALYYGTTARAAAMRRAPGVQSVFNLLGPLPTRPARRANWSMCGTGA